MGGTWELPRSYVGAITKERYRWMKENREDK
jgi:hypothetical protein